MYFAGQGWAVLALIGASIGLIAAFLNIVTVWLSDIKDGYCTVGFYLCRNFCCSGEESCKEWHAWTVFGPFDYLMYVLFCTLFSFVAAFLVFAFAPYAAGSGISEIKCIIAGFVMKGFLGAKTLAIKSITLPLTIASGLSVGKEGPSVHYAVCVGNTISGLFTKYREYNSKRREILCACTAAGVAVAFGSPIGGVLFSLEEMTASFQLKTMWRSYFCALVATGVLKIVNPFRTGQLVIFSVSYDRDWHYFEIMFYLIIGIFGGVFGIFVIKWNLRVQAFRKNYLGNYAIEEATILAAFTAIICYFNQFLKIDMTESMQILFHECDGNWDSHLCQSDHSFHILMSLMFAVVIRTVLVIISYGCKVPAGIFVPSMAIGALFGRMIGTLVKMMHESVGSTSIFSSCPVDVPCITPGTYAFLGAAASLSGIMNITVTVVVIMFELTGALKYILPTMIVIGTTKIINDRWGKGGIADQMIWFNGYPYIDNKEEHVSFDVQVEMAMTKRENLTCISCTRLTGQQVKEIVKQRHEGYPIIDQDNYLVGYISRTDLEYAIRNLDDDTLYAFDNTNSAFSKYINYTPLSVNPSMAIQEVVEIFQKLGPRVVLISHFGKLEGLITRKDVLRFQFRVEHDTNMRDETLVAQAMAVSELDKQVWEFIVKCGQKCQQYLGAAVRTNWR